MATIKEWQKEQLKRAAAMKSIKPVFLAASSAHAEQVGRIFEKGKKANGQNIGTYTNDQYKKRRKKRGRQISKVDLKLSGLLQLDYANSLQVSGLKVVAGLKNTKENEGKFDGSVDRYGIEIWQLSEKEKKIYIEALGDIAGDVFVNA